MPNARTVLTARGPVESVVRGSGPAVVVLHGSPGGLDQAELMGGFLLDHGFSVVALSRPGYGGTPMLTGLESPAAQADQVAALLDALGIGRAGVFAWSGGGPAAIELAARHPGRVRALALLAPVTRSVRWRTSAIDHLLFGTWPGRCFLRLSVRLAPGWVVDSAIDSAGTLTGAERRQRTAEVLADPARRALVLAMAERAGAEVDRRRGLIADQQACEDLDDLPFESVDARTLIVQGDADREVPVADAELAAELIPGARLLLMPGGTHMCLFADPGFAEAQAEVAAALR